MITFYNTNNKKNKKCFNSISMILKFYKLIQAYNCYNINWKIYIICYERQKIDWVRYIFIIIDFIYIILSKNIEYKEFICYYHKDRSIINIFFNNTYFLCNKFLK